MNLKCYLNKKISNVNTALEYGRGCNDIGCLPTEECVISSDSCSQRDGKDCGSYPTCKRKSGVSTSASSSSVNPSGDYYHFLLLLFPIFISLSVYFSFYYLFYYKLNVLSVFYLMFSFNLSLD